MLWEMAILQNRCPITPLRRPLTYKDMTLYPDIKVMTLFPTESFEKNFENNSLIQAMLNSSNRETKNVRHMKCLSDGQ